MRYMHHIYYTNGAIYHRSDETQRPPAHFFATNARFVIYHVATKNLWRVYEPREYFRNDRNRYFIPRVSKVPTFPTEDAAIAYVGLKL